MTYEAWINGIKQLNVELNKESLGIIGLINRIAENAKKEENKGDKNQQFPG